MSSEAVSTESPPRLQYVQHHYLPHYAFPATPGDTTLPPVLASADASVLSSHARLARSLSRLADSVSGQLFRTSHTPASPVTSPVSATTSAGLPGVAASTASVDRVDRVDRVPDAAHQHFLPMCPDPIFWSHIEGLYARTYYTGFVKAADCVCVEDGAESLEQPADGEDAFAVPHTDKASLVSVVYAVLPPGGACPLIPRNALPDATSTVPVASSWAGASDAHDRRLRFPPLTIELVMSTLEGACTADALVQPPTPTRTQTAAEAQPVPLWLCTYNGGFRDGRRHGLGTLIVYGHFSLCCLWDGDVPVVQPLASPALDATALCGASWTCSVLKEHLVVVVVSQAAAASAEPQLPLLRARCRTGAVYMGGLAVLTLDAQDGAAARPLVEASDFRGLRWLATSRFVPQGFGELRRRAPHEGRHVTGTSRQDDEEEGDDEDPDLDDVSPAALQAQTRSAAQTASMAKGRPSGGAELTPSLPRPHRQGGRYLRASTSPCLPDMSASTPTASRTGICVDVEWYCGGWQHGARHGFGVLVGAASLLSAASSGPATVPGLARPRRRRLVYSGEPCTYIGHFTHHKRCGPAILEMDRTGMLLGGTWGDDGRLQPRVPHSLLYHGEPPFCLQGLLLQSGGGPGQGVEGQVLAAAATMRGREEDVSAPLAFDQATLLQSAGVVRGTWEPLLASLDGVLGDLCVTLQRDRAAPSAVLMREPVAEMQEILARLAALPEWCATLAGFQRCFAALYAPCTGLPAQEEETDGEAPPAPTSPSSEQELIAFLMAQSVAGRRGTAAQTTSHVAFSWCREAFAARPSDGPAGQSLPNTMDCIHTARACDRSGRPRGGRPFVRCRERTPLRLFRHAVQLLGALVTSLRLRALPLLADRPWAAELLAASASPHKAGATRTASAGPSTASTGEPLAEALAQFCWSQAYAPVAPILFHLARGCVKADVEEAYRQLLLAPFSTRTTTADSAASAVEGAPGRSVMMPPLSRSALLAASTTDADWLTVFDPDHVRAWRYEAAVLSGADRYAPSSLASLYQGIERCLYLPRSALVGCNRLNVEHANAATTEQRARDMGQPDARTEKKGKEESEETIRYAQSDVDTAEEVSLIGQLSTLCVAPTTLRGSCQAQFRDTINGPLLAWGSPSSSDIHASASAAASASPTSASTAAWSLSEAVDVMVSLVHHAVSLFPRSLARQQQWLRYAVVAAARLVVAEQHAKEQEEEEEGQTPTPPRSSPCSVLEAVGFNPFAPLLQLHAVLVRPGHPLPLPELSTLLLRDLTEQQRLERRRHHTTTTTTTAVPGAASGSEPQDLRTVLHALLVRVACTVASLTHTYPTSAAPTITDARAFLSAPVGGSLRELSARARFVLSPTASHRATARAGAHAVWHLLHRSTNNSTGSSSSSVERSATLDPDRVSTVLRGPHGPTLSRVLAPLLGQCTEAMELALFAAGWAGVVPSAVVGEEETVRDVPSRQTRALRPARTRVSVNPEKQRATEATRVLAQLWGPAPFAATESSSAAPSSGSWVPEALRAALSLPDGPAAAATPMQSLHARVPATSFMRWVMGCTAQSLSLSRAVPASTDTYRRFVPAHKVSAVAAPVRSADVGDDDNDEDDDDAHWAAAGLTEGDVWYVVLLLLYLDGLGWCLSLSISLRRALPETGTGGLARTRADSVPNLLAPLPREDSRSLAAETSTPLVRKHALFSSSSSSSSSAAVSPLSSPSASPACSPPKLAEAPLSAALARRSLTNVGGGGLFDGPEFRLSLRWTGTGTVPLGLEWQVLEQACAVVARQC